MLDNSIMRQEEYFSVFEEIKGHIYAAQNAVMNICVAVRSMA